MKVAVLTLTRDRLAYSRHCFQTLRDNAGCEFDWYVLDQASTDGTPDWLLEQDDLDVTILDENWGISRGLNLLLDEAAHPSDYDVIVKFDNDCELTQPDTLRDICELVAEGGCLLSPRILGLQHPPQPIRELRIRDETILDIPQIGGIFLAAPAFIYEDFRYNESNPLWGMDDVEVCRHIRQRGGTCGYVERLEAWHYLGTNGQRADDPDYFRRKDAEYGALA